MNDDIYSYSSLQFGNNTIESGTTVSFKKKRGVFYFISLMHNKRLNKTWISCLDSKTGKVMAFPVDELAGIVQLKRSRLKKNG